MSQRVPCFTHWDNLGLCVVYPVSIHVSGRQWEDKDILVPLKAWNEGVRKFGFMDASFGVSQPEYIPSAKVEKSIQKAVEDCLIWYKKVNKLYQLREELRNTKDELCTMLKDYQFALTPFL